MKPITRDEYLEALAIVHRYTLEEIRKDKFTVENIVVENNRINAIHENIRDIIKHYGLDKRDGRGKLCRKNSLVQKRQALIWWLRQNTSKSLDEIGVLVCGLHHSTAIHSIERVEAAIEVNDKLFIEDVQPILDTLEPYKKEK